MVDTKFTLVSGTYADEQSLMSELDFFMVNTIGGWSRVKVISDTTLDKSIVYYTDGTSSGTVYDRFWLKLQATNDALKFTAMSNFNPSGNLESDSFGSGVGFTDLDITVSGTYWFAANKDAVHVLIQRSSDGVSLLGGFGTFVSYYTPDLDPKPFYVFGAVALDATFDNWDRLQAYGPHSWGVAYSATYSGSVRSYFAAHPAAIQYGNPNPRSGQPKLIEPVFYSNSTFGAVEVRGEVPGLYMVGGYGVTTGNLVDVNVMPPTVSGVYLIHRHSDVNAWAIGPVTVSGSE